MLSSQDVEKLLKISSSLLFHFHVMSNLLFSFFLFLSPTKVCHHRTVMLWTSRKLFFLSLSCFFLSFSLCVVLSVSEELLWRRNCHFHSWPRFYTDFLVSNFHSFPLCSVCNMRKALIVFSSRDLFSFLRCCAFLLCFSMMWESVQLQCALWAMR